MSKANSEVRTAMLADLTRSGLQKYVRHLGVRLLTTEQLSAQYPALTSIPLDGYVIPYFDIQRKPIKDFFRYRYLQDPPVWDSGKPVRYVQPKNAAPRLYTPRIFDWADWLKQSPRTLIITEGEKKAACGCAFGFPTVALGGVWCFKSTRQSQALLPDLVSLPWEGTRVVIAYDSDAATNPHVVKAENALARELLNQKATVFVLRFPASGEKVGLDDYLVENGAEALDTLLCESAVEWAASRELREMNEEATFVRQTTEVMVGDDLYSPKRFFDLFADRNYAVKTTVRMPNGGTSEKLTEKNAAREWFKWPGRNKVQRFIYEPGKPSLIPNGEYPDYNVWPGWGTEPKKGDVKPFLELVDYLLADCRPEERAWFRQWLAYPIQHPGTKLFSCVLLRGGQGTLHRETPANTTENWLLERSSGDSGPAAPRRKRSDIRLGPITRRVSPRPKKEEGDEYTKDEHEADHKPGQAIRE